MTKTHTQHRFFTLIAFSLPVIFVGLMELTLRLFNIGERPPIYIASAEHPQWLMPNPKLIERYFLSAQAAPAVSPDTQYFLPEKSPNSIRIIAIGGSSMAGFPYGRFGSPAAFLQQRLNGLYPQRDIEVINFALSAVNSYTLIDITPELITLAPDAVYIYAGHNEYLGIMGVGSQYSGWGSVWLNRMVMQLHDLHLFRALGGLITSLTRAEADNITHANSHDASQRTVMARVAKDQNIAFGSERYHLGLRQFRENMHDVLSLLTKQDIPVLFSTIASNQRDQAPFTDTYELTPAQSSLPIEQRYQAHPNHASTVFAYANWLLKQGNTQAASSQFMRASDLDGLRFRAPQAINEIIKALANADEQVTLIDAQQALQQRSANAIIGASLMWEHLHPNARGYFYIAEAALPAVHNLLAEQHGLSPALNGLSFNALSTEQAWQTRLVNPADEFVAASKVAALVADYPFVAEPITPQYPPALSDAERIGQQRLRDNDWFNQQRQLLALYQQQQAPLNAANIAASLAQALRFTNNTALTAGRLYNQANQPALAQYYARHAVATQPSDIQGYFTLAQAQYRQGMLYPSLDTLNRILEIAPRHPEATRLINQLNAEVGGR